MSFTGGRTGASPFHAVALLLSVFHDVLSAVHHYGRGAALVYCVPRYVHAYVGTLSYWEGMLATTARVGRVDDSVRVAR